MEGISISLRVSAKISTSSNFELGTLIVDFTEKCLVQSCNGFDDATLFDRESQVDARRSLGNQRDINIINRAEHSCRNAWCPAQAFTNHTHNRSISIHCYCPELL